MDSYWIPRNLDAPPLLFIWEFDSASIAIFWAVVGVIMKIFIIGLTVAFISYRIFSMIKEKEGRGLIVKFFYWHTPVGAMISKNYPSYEREYIG